MKKWEYTAVVIGNEEEDKKIIPPPKQRFNFLGLGSSVQVAESEPDDYLSYTQKLNQYGKLGWELVSVTELDYGEFLATFKREVSNTPDQW